MRVYHVGKGRFAAFEDLVGCEYTQIFTVDGEKVAFFHNKPFEGHEIEVFQKLTADQLEIVLSLDYDFVWQRIEES